MMQDKRVQIAASVVFLLILGAVVIAGVLNNQANQQSVKTQDGPPFQDLAVNSQKPSEAYLGQTYLKNLELLQPDFKDTEYMFVNRTLIDFAKKNFAQDRELTIDSTSYQQRDSSSYGFNVIDQNNNQMFYVIVTKTGSGVSVKEFL